MYPKTIELMKQMVKMNNIPGISYAFVSQDKQIEGIIGLKQVIPKEILLEKDTLYDMASLTKVICTTTLILTLVEENKISIEQPIAHYIDDMLDKEVTIKELLTHTSDINGFIPNRNELSQVDLKKAILKLTSGENRGKVVKYTDTGTILLGFLIEKIYNKPLHDVFQEKILEPLQMKRSGFSNVDNLLVAPTEWDEIRGLIKGEVHDPKAYILKEHCGSAGLFSTISDTLHFVEMMFNKGRYKETVLLEEKTINDLLKNHSQDADKVRSLGWDLISFENRYLLFHTGYTGTFMILDIEPKEAFIFLSNRVHPVDNRDEYLKMRDELIRIYLMERTVT